MFCLLPERSGVLYNKEAEAGGTGSRRGGGCVLLCVAVCACGWQLLASLCQGPACAQWGDLGAQAPGLPTPNVAAQPGSAHPNPCPQDVCPGARGRWAWCLGAGLWNHTHLPFPSGSVASKSLNSSELIGLIWKWANNGS